MGELNRLTATAAAARLARREISCEELARDCLDRIAAREGEVRAFAHIDRAAVLRAARDRDRAPPAGPLHGIPIAVKDVIATSDMPTEYNSPIYAGHRPVADAACVAAVRAAGAVILGKTVTAEFAYNHPGPTRNPRDLAHTPGGSSSGSAAAVADFMAPLAFATQTGGSTIRPAAYCGIFGFKPSYGRHGLAGVKPLSLPLDTLGFHARSVEDLALIDGVLAGESALPPAPLPGKIRIALADGLHRREAEPAALEALDAAADALRRAGALVERTPLPDGIARLSEINRMLMSAGAAVALAPEFARDRAGLSPALRRLIETGQEVSAAALLDALAALRAAEAALDTVFRRCDALLTLSAPGEAPAMALGTGNSLFNRAWTTLGTPCLTLPFGAGSAGLPLGIQLVGRRGADRELLALAAGVARWLDLVPPGG